MKKALIPGLPLFPLVLALALILSWTMATAAPAAAPGPKEMLKGEIDNFIALLKDPKYKGAGPNPEQDKKIWEIIHRVFDFKAVAVRALGRNWRSFSPAEQDEFSQVFADLLGRNYLRQIRDGYRDEKVSIDEEQMLSQQKALVKTRIQRAGGDIPVDYRLWLSPTGWRVYDVNVEGVSLVKNYRAQFSDILIKKKPAELIQQIKDKLAKEKADDKG